MTPVQFISALVGSKIPTGCAEFYQKIQEICAGNGVMVRFDFNVGKVASEFCAMNFNGINSNTEYCTMLGNDVLVTSDVATLGFGMLHVTPGRYGSKETGLIRANKKDLLVLDMDMINSWSNEFCNIRIEKSGAGYQLFVEFQDVIMTSNVGVTHILKQIEIGAKIIPFIDVDNVKLNYCKRNPKLRTKLENAQGFIHGHFHGSDTTPYHGWCYGDEYGFQGFRIKKTEDVDRYITEMRRFVGYESNNPYNNNVKALYNSKVAVLSPTSNTVQGRVDFFDNEFSTVELASILRTVLEPSPMKAVKVTPEHVNQAEMAQFELFKKEKVVLV